MAPLVSLEWFCGGASKVQVQKAFDEALSCMAAGAHEKASLILEKINEALPGTAPVLNALAICYTRLGRSGEAVEKAALACQGDEPDGDYLHTLALAQNQAGLLESSLETQEKSYRRFLSLGHDASREDIVRSICNYLCSAELRALDFKNWHARFCMYSGLLVSMGWPLDAMILNAAASIRISSFGDNKSAEIRVRSILDFFQFEKHSPLPHLEAIFHGLALPWLQEVAHSGLYRLTMQIESYIYHRYVKARETEAHFFQAYAAMAPTLLNAGRGQHAPLLPRPLAGGGRRLKLAFFLHSGQRIGHVDVLLSQMKALSVSGDTLFDKTIYVVKALDEDVAEEFRHYGARVVSLEKDWFRWNSPNHVPLQYLRNRLAEEGVDVLVWVSVPIWMLMAFSMRVAPVQIWFAMKYHALSFEEIDGYLAGGALTQFRTIDGRVWRNVRAGLSGLYDSTKEHAASELRATFGNCIVLGCFAREEKLDSPDFLEAICQLLAAHPEAVFLWTGRKERASIRRVFEKHGVFAQTRFIGWVDTLLYVQVVDVYLDCFPFPCGLTAMQAMAAARPVVFYMCKESLDCGIVGMVKSISSEPCEAGEARLLDDMMRGSSGKSLFLASTSVDTYLDNAGRLLDDPVLRAEVGQAMKAFSQTYLTNAAPMAQDLSKHVCEIYSAKTVGLQGGPTEVRERLT